MPYCNVIGFDFLVIRGTVLPKQVYTLSHMTQFDNLLGGRWYLRGLNATGDFCFVTHGLVLFKGDKGKDRLSTTK